MITPDQVLIMVQPVDMRLGLDALSSLVQQALGNTACDCLAQPWLIGLVVWVRR